jgi:hypothetical protein
MTKTEAQTELTRVTERLELYYEAEKKILAGQSYRIGTRQLTRADLSSITAQIETLKRQKAELEIAVRTGVGPYKRRTVRVLFRDL